MNDADSSDPRKPLPGSRWWWARMCLLAVIVLYFCLPLLYALGLWLDRF